MPRARCCHAEYRTARRRFIDALRALHESRLYLQLGFPDIAAYADATFRYQRTQVYEFLRVSKALLALSRVASAFERGEISWSLVSELTRVSNAETEGEWLEYLGGRSVRAVLAELKDAQTKRRDRPRRDGYGLPGLPVWAERTRPWAASRFGDGDGPPMQLSPGVEPRRKVLPSFETRRERRVSSSARSG